MYRQYTTKSGRNSAILFNQNHLSTNDSSSTSFHPLLNKNVVKLKELKCCGARIKVFFQSCFIVLKCLKCFGETYYCLCCGKDLATKKGFKKHFETSHSTSECCYCSNFSDNNSSLDSILFHYVGHCKGMLNKKLDIIEEVEDVKMKDVEDEKSEPEDEKVEIKESNEDFLCEDFLSDGCEIPDDVDETEEKLEESGENEMRMPKINDIKWKNRMKSQITHFCEEDCEVKIEPITPFDDYGKFKYKQNLHMYRIGCKNGMGENELQDLINSMDGVFDCDFDFFSARKMNEISKGLEGIKPKRLNCPKGHKVLVIPIEEMLRYKFGEQDFLYSFHCAPETIDDNERIDSFHKTPYFKKIVEENSNSHVIFIVGFRDKFPGYVTTYFPIKGFYYMILNISFPEVLSNVCLFSQGGVCDMCLDVVDQEWVKNINKLSSQFFCVNHPWVDKFVKFKMCYVIELEDNPEKAANTMSKYAGAIIGCHTCKKNKSDYDNPNVTAPEKTLEESKRLFFEKYNDLNVRGKKTEIEKWERENGYTFTEYQFNPEKKSNERVFKKPSSFFKLNDEIIRKLLFPPENFHSIVKDYFENYFLQQNQNNGMFFQKLLNLSYFIGT